MNKSLLEVYNRLYQSFGPQDWWPAESPFEIMVGAILVQNTAWINVTRAIENLRREALLAPLPLYELPVAELEELIRPAGYFRLKTARLRNLLRLVVEEYDASLTKMFAVDRAELREQLLQVKGIGPETADSILLYAAGIPTFVVDTYTLRVLARHGWIGYDAQYSQAQELLQVSLPREVRLYNEFHALFVRVGREFCRRKKPRCESCPLVGLLPERGIVTPD